MDAASLRDRIKNAAPELWGRATAVVDPWVAPILANLAQFRGRRPFPKTFNDPIWGTIELYPWEVAILDSPLLQRLRGIRQLGLAHHVYPGAQHTRLEHTLGVVEASDRMIRSLERNAQNHREFGSDRDESVSKPTQMDVRSTRLGALLHDIGHGPFSHVTEDLIRATLATEFDTLENVLIEGFPGTTRIATSEMLAVVFVLGEPMQRVFEHPDFGAVTAPSELAPAIASRILGSRSWLKATYLSGVVSGPLDADKLDYMARDSHHTGLPIALDVNRLIGKLDVVTVTEENALNPELRARAAASPGRRFYEMGIALSTTVL